MSTVRFGQRRVDGRIGSRDISSNGILRISTVPLPSHIQRVTSGKKTLNILAAVSRGDSRHLGELERSWNQLAADDPLWAVLSDPSKKGNRWRLDEFFASGQQEIQQILAYLESLGVPARRERALDFGCGVGRLTQALSDHFSQVSGVDIAPNMVEQARRFNRHGDRVRYFVNSVPDLTQFEPDSFEFAYSSLVLQHMHPHLQERFITELVRLLADDGVLVFQVIHPTRALEPRAVLKSAVPLALLEAYRRHDVAMRHASNSGGYRPPRFGSGFGDLER
jgi:SAM-dependent methyltransferase